MLHRRSTRAHVHNNKSFGTGFFASLFISHNFLLNSFTLYLRYNYVSIRNDTTISLWLRSKFFFVARFWSKNAQKVIFVGDSFKPKCLSRNALLPGGFRWRKHVKPLDVHLATSYFMHRWESRAYWVVVLHLFIFLILNLILYQNSPRNKR